MSLDIKPPEGSLTFVGMLLTAINGLFVAVSAMALYILRGHKQRVDDIEREAKERADQIEAAQKARSDEIERKHAMLSAAHTEALIAQSNFVTRDDMEEYLRQMEDRWDHRQKLLHGDNVEWLKRIEGAINTSRADTRDDINRIHKRIDEINRR